VSTSQQALLQQSYLRNAAPPLLWIVFLLQFIPQPRLYIEQV
jgi:hypothetical protein